MTELLALAGTSGTSEVERGALGLQQARTQALTEAKTGNTGSAFAAVSLAGVP